MKRKLILTQTIILFAGTIFSWTNFLREYFSYCKSCGGDNPFQSTYFYGAILFFAALILNVFIFAKSSKK